MLLQYQKRNITYKDVDNTFTLDICLKLKNTYKEEAEGSYFNITYSILKKDPNKKSKLADNFHCNITNFCHNDAYSGSKPIDRLVLKLLLIDVEEASIFWGLTKKEAEFLIKEINVENYNFVKEWLISLE